LVAKESDPENGAYVYFAKPLNGVTGISGLVKGDNGKHTEFQEAVDFTSLAYNDATASSMSVVEVTPGSDTVSQVVKLAVALHEGVPGADGTTSLDLDSITGTSATGKSIVVNASNDGFDYATLWTGGMHWPATVSETSAQTAGATLSTITVATNTYLSDWRPLILASTTINGSTTDVIVDIIARLNNATTGAVVGRGYGINGTNDKLVLNSGPDAGASSSVNKINAGDAATIYLRTEKQSGTATYSTSHTRFSLVAVRA
jgi:hypothetical protein